MNIFTKYRHTKPPLTVADGAVNDVLAHANQRRLHGAKRRVVVVLKGAAHGPRRPDVGELEVLKGQREARVVVLSEAVVTAVLERDVAEAAETCMTS